MAVTGVRASLVVHGRHPAVSAAAVTAALGMEPTHAHEAGEPRAGAMDGRVWAASAWIVEEPATVSSVDDPHGMASLDRLVARFGPRAAALATLARDYDIRVHLGADSESEQGGFVIEPETLRGLAALGAALVADVWLVDPADAPASRGATSLG